MKEEEAIHGKTIDKTVKEKPDEQLPVKYRRRNTLYVRKWG